MDITFFATSATFIFFVIISYYLDVIRLSVPLVIIYLFFCFNYLVNIDQKSPNTKPILKNDNNYKQSSPLVTKKVLNNDIQKITIDKPVSNPRPIVSYNPKPIIIDSNIIIQKDLDTKIETVSNSGIDLLKNLKNAESNSNIQENTLQLNEIMICRGIYKRNPIKPGYSFINSVDSLFCYTKISNSGVKQEIKHVWFFENKEISAVVYNIKTSYNYRSWSKKNIYPKQVGNWRVDVVDSKGNILGTRDFLIESISNAY